MDEIEDAFNTEIHPIIKRYIPMVKCIAETFGNHCEVVLHEFSKLPNSLVEIQNGHVTGRSIGSPMTEFSLNVVKHGDTNEDIMNYTGKSMEGKVLKSSTVFIKDDEGKTIGCFCINLDMTELYAAKQVLDEIMRISDDDKKREDQIVVNKVNSVLNDIVIRTIEESGKPVAYLSKDEKVTIVKSLELQGAFLIKGAIDYVAKVLCVSRYTIYNYLDEVREV